MHANRHHRMQCNGRNDGGRTRTHKLMARSQLSNGFEDRNRSSQPVPRRHGGASFVSENCHLHPVLTRLFPGLVAELGDKMATTAETLSI